MLRLGAYLNQLLDTAPLLPTGGNSRKRIVAILRENLWCGNLGLFGDKFDHIRCWSQHWRI
jgi:hypothetical protein